MKTYLRTRSISPCTRSRLLKEKKIDEGKYGVHLNPATAQGIGWEEPPASSRHKVRKTRTLCRCYTRHKTNNCVQITEFFGNN